MWNVECGIHVRALYIISSSLWCGVLVLLVAANGQPNSHTVYNNLRVVVIGLVLYI